ncbi:MAG: nickel pincer cofactor biosynthesis protein LarC [Myxococcota bacterium]
MSKSKAARRRSSKRSQVPRETGTLLHLDVFSGIAGNMFLGAVLDLGLPRKVLEEDLARLGVDHRLVVKRVKRGALAGRYVDVRVPGAGGRYVSADAAHGVEGAHGRGLRSICRQIERAKLAPPVRDRAIEVFEALGRAEARVHRTTLEKVHFHEVGAADALVDIVGACIAIHRLEVTSVTSSPVALGHGQVESAHGILPLPAPATLELLKGIPTVPAHVAWETVTPTGAALLRTLVDDFGSLPAMTVDAVGYGAGQDREGPVPNLLRVVKGHRSGIGADRVVVLETNLDDLVPEHFEYLMERLLEAGALDVGLQHLQMKKNRPGFLVRVLARPQHRSALAQILFAESTAIGVRSSEWDRLVLPRQERSVNTAYGRIRVKVIGSQDGSLAFSPEYDDCKRAARKSGVPLRDVIRAAETAARDDAEAG